MNGCLVKLCIFLSLTVEGTRGSELTINVMKNASVTLVCYSTEDLKKCICPSYPQNCQRCIDTTRQDIPFKYNGSEKYFMLSGLEYSNSGLYVCSRQHYSLGRRYRLNVLEDHQDPTVVIGTVNQTMVMSCGTELDIMAASEKHWCRLSSANLCQPDTVMGPDNKSRGDFNILDSNGSFSLEKRQLTLNDTGFYRFTQITPNQTKAYVVELQVKDESNFLQISPVQVESKPDEPFQINCQYSQDLREFSKSWLCDSSECDDTVRSVDDRFQSALVLSIDHVACSKIKSFQCVAKEVGSSVHSNVYSKPSYKNPTVEVPLSYDRYNRKVTVKVYTQLKLICYKPDRYDYDRYNRGRYRHDDYIYRPQQQWCKVSSPFQCVAVTDNVKDTSNSIILQICATPNDAGTTYRCPSSRGYIDDVEIAVIVPPPPSSPRSTTPAGNRNIPLGPETENRVGIIILVTLMCLFAVLTCVTVTRYKGKKLRERLFARRTPLSAVDIHANTYANSLANYYSQQQVPPPDKQGDDKDTTSSLDDDFEELPVSLKKSSSGKQEETDYVRVRLGGGAWPQNADALLKDSEQFGYGGLPLRTRDHASGSGRKSEVGHTSKTNADKVVKKQDEDADDDDDVTYTHVTIKPKHGHK